MCWFCDHPDATRADYLDLVREKIARFGWATQHVERDQIHPPWSYTVGLTAFDKPELVVTGLPMHRASALLHRLADHTLPPGIPNPGYIKLLNGPCIQIVEVAEPAAHLDVAVDLFGPRIRAIQAVHADDRGHCPWETGYRGVRGGQPVLGNVPSPTAGQPDDAPDANSPAPAAAGPASRSPRMVRTQPSRGSGSRRGTRGPQRRSARSPSRPPSPRR